jgi:hypothetical protein
MTLSPSDWIDYKCAFCKAILEKITVLPPDCDCEGYKTAHEEWLEEYRSRPDYQPPLVPEEYEKKYPVTYFGERLIFDKDGTHKLKLEARQYNGGEGLCVWIPFPRLDEDGNETGEDNSGLAWDFTDYDAEALHDLLGEYLEKRK